MSSNSEGVASHLLHTIQTVKCKEEFVTGIFQYSSSHLNYTVTTTSFLLEKGLVRQRQNFWSNYEVDILIYSLKLNLYILIYYSYILFFSHTEVNIWLSRLHMCAYKIICGTMNNSFKENYYWFKKWNTMENEIGT